MITIKLKSEWEIELTMTINFISSKDSKETCITHAKSDNIEVMIGNKTDEIIKECFNSLLQRYQQQLEKQMEEREFFLIVLINCITNFIE